MSNVLGGLPLMPPQHTRDHRHNMLSKVRKDCRLPGVNMLGELPLVPPLGTDFRVQQTRDQRHTHGAKARRGCRPFPNQRTPGQSAGGARHLATLAKHVAEARASTSTMLGGLPSAPPQQTRDHRHNMLKARRDCKLLCINGHLAKARISTCPVHAERQFCMPFLQCDA